MKTYEVPCEAGDDAVGLPRRRFLVRMGGCLVALGLDLGCSSDAMGEDTPEATGSAAVGNVATVPVGSLRFVAGKSLVLGRDGGGLYAMTSVCTHRRCDMSRSGSVSSAGLSCGCHGSTFSTNGEVLSGPAPQPLKHFRVDLAPDGTITINAAAVVDPTIRTPVPV